MTDPQAELLEQLQLTIANTLDKINNPEKSSLLSQGNFEEAGIILEDLLPLLATALEEQRASMIAEIESWLVDEEVHELENASWDEMRQQASKIGRNELRAELRAKLVEMKGGKCQNG